MTLQGDTNQTRGGGGRGEKPGSGTTYWRECIVPYERPHLGRSLFGLATSVIPFFAGWGLMYLALDVSYLLTLALALPTAGFLLRTYILFHDCAHGSFLRSRRANAWVGAILALIVFTPFQSWRRSHAVHHATSGDLDRRGTGDVPTLTVAEYYGRPWRGRLAYRLFRNPIVMFGLGPFYAMVLAPRWVSPSARPRIVRSVWGTNLALALALGALCWWLGWQGFLLVQLPLVVLAGGTGIWLFYVQHQFEDTYWQSSGEWSYADAALRGSSYLKLPRWLQFFTGNIGLHHVHHLSTKVPNYNLQRAHDENPIFHGVPTLSLWDGLRAGRLKLWDEDSRRLVTWAEAREIAAAARPRNGGDARTSGASLEPAG
jgi:omega-6 fatty acid desaturase (delta-12 desaturase)